MADPKNYSSPMSNDWMSKRPKVAPTPTKVDPAAASNEAAATIRKRTPDPATKPTPSYPISEKIGSVIGSLIVGLGGAKVKRALDRAAGRK